MMKSILPLHAPEQILEAIGRTIGIDDLSFDAHGHRALVFTSGRHFGFQKIVPGVLIYVAEPIPFNIPGVLTEAMKRAHASQAEWTVQVMLRNGNGINRSGSGNVKSSSERSGNFEETCLLAMIRLTGKQASIPFAQRALTYLSEWNPAQGRG